MRVATRWLITGSLQFRLAQLFHVGAAGAEDVADIGAASQVLQHQFVAFSIFLVRLSPICVAIAFLQKVLRCRASRASPALRNAPMVRWRGTGGSQTSLKATMIFRARYFLIACVVLITVVGLIGWHLFGGRGEVLKPDGGPLVTVMDFGQPFPLDPLPSG